MSFKSDAVFSVEVPQMSRRDLNLKGPSDDLRPLPEAEWGPLRERCLRQQHSFEASGQHGELRPRLPRASGHVTREEAGHSRVGQPQLPRNFTLSPSGSADSQGSEAHGNDFELLQGGQMPVGSLVRV